MQAVAINLGRGLCSKICRCWVRQPNPANDVSHRQTERQPMFDYVSGVNTLLIHGGANIFSTMAKPTKKLVLKYRSVLFARLC